MNKAIKLSIILFTLLAVLIIALYLFLSLGQYAGFDTLKAVGNLSPIGLWSDGKTMWVTDGSKLYAYNLITKERVPAEDFDTLKAAGDIHPVSLWSNGATMWVTDIHDGKVYAYNITTKERDPAKDFDTKTPSSNGVKNPYGLWSDGKAIWVMDRSNVKLCAYDMAFKRRDPVKDFDLLKVAGNRLHGRSNFPLRPVRRFLEGERRNTFPSGFWSDGKTLWVVDGMDVEIYVYDMATGKRVYWSR